MLFGIYLPNYGTHASHDAMAEIAVVADELGYDTLWVAERLLVPDPPNQEWSEINTTAYEPLITLAYISSLTRTIKLGTNVLIVPFRNPLVLARQTATLDRFSEGRLILGLGLGWMAQEFSASGIDMSERGRRTDETIDLLREVWEKSIPSFTGQFTQFASIYFEPKPVQKKIPIWIGGNSDAALKRVVQKGDGWTPTGLSVEQIQERIAFIKTESQRQGRSLDQIALSYSSAFTQTRDGIRDMRKSLETYRQTGITHFGPGFQYDAIPEMIEQMKVFAQEFVHSD